jgi:hypothetical protein
MKKILNVALLTCFSAAYTFAQPTGPQGDANYTFPQFNGPKINGIITPLTTDPRVTKDWITSNPGDPAVQIGPDFKRNYFPWFSETAPNTGLNAAYEYKMIGYQNMIPVPGQLYNEIISPFAIDNANGYTMPLRFKA